MGDGPEVRVIPSTLAAKGTEITNGWPPNPPDQAHLPAPCGYDLAAAAIERLTHDGTRLGKCVAAGKTEGSRLGDSFHQAAKAYEKVDERTTVALDAHPPKPVPTDPVIPDHTTINRDPEDKTGPSTRAVTADGMTLDESAEAIAKPDQGHSLGAFASTWRNHATALEQHADSLNFANVNWEGDAADAAYDKLRALQEWMKGVATSCRNLADNADEIASAHSDAYAAHPKLGEVKALEARVQAAIHNQDPDAGELFKEWLAWQKQADEIRETYARRVGSLPSVNPQWPPDCAPGAASVRTNGDPRQPADPGKTPGPDSGHESTGGGSGGGGGPLSGSSPAAPVSPMSAQSPQTPSQEQPAAQSPQTSSPSSGGSQGGSPSGGAGGGMPGGLPAAAKASPHLPKGPSLKPASAGGHGGGAGGGAGGGGPLQPAVTGSAVAPSHGAAAHGAQAGHAGPTAPAGAGGGGGAPMGGQGGHGQGGKERRRTPGLSPDEELYKEDREWTEGVIGHRKRRDVQGGKDSEGSK